MFDDEPVTPQTQIQLGDDLAALSISDLEERREALRAEIARVDAALDDRQAGRAAAEAVFGGG